MIREELGRIEWQGEQVYCTQSHIVLASMMIVKQLMPLLPKDDEEINAQVKCLHASHSIAMNRSEQNLSKTLVNLMFPLFSTFVSSPTFNNCHKPR
jgi:hypothetical protein